MTDGLVLPRSTDHETRGWGIGCCILRDSHRVGTLSLYRHQLNPGDCAEGTAPFLFLLITRSSDLKCA